MPDIPPFRPDAGELVSSTINNVFMTANGYTPRPTLAAAPGAAVFASGVQCRGAFGGLVPGGAFSGFLATSTDIYKLSATYGYTDIGNVTIPTGEDQAFCQFGVFMLTSNTTDGLYAYNMETPAGLNAVSGAPKPRYMFPSNNTVIALGNGTNKQEWQYCVRGDHTNWTSKGVFKQSLNDGGAFTGGGDLGNGSAILLQQEAVRRVDWGAGAGGAAHALRKVADDVGCVHPRAQATYNGATIFLDWNGWLLTDGQSVTNIGADKINDWFKERCPDLKKVYVSVDPVHTVFRIRYKSINCNSDIIFEDILDYNYVTREWIPGTEQTVAIFRMATPGYVLDDLDSFGALDAWSAYPLDSDFWQGGNNPVLAGLNSASKFGFFDGAYAAATLETATQTDGLSKLVNRARLLSDDGSATIQLGVKDDLADAIAWKTAASKIGKRYPLRGRGVYQRYRINHPAAGTWTRSLGVAGINEAEGGER
jgi:hypothetical protein